MEVDRFSRERVHGTVLELRENTVFHLEVVRDRCRPTSKHFPEINGLRVDFLYFMRRSVFLLGAVELVGTQALSSSCLKPYLQFFGDCLNQFMRRASSASSARRLHRAAVPT